ncbi:MAG TPA: exodeoxyribonuclease III [Synergistaceae bacterium]|nr:exodeoxyribonuclease III [Synergistaceae bacterium]
MPFSVATFNANSVRSRLHIIERWLKDNHVDILCLQETKVSDEDFPKEVFEGWGYHVVYKGDKGYSGVATASLLSPDEVCIGFNDGEEPNDGARLLRTRFGDLHVINTYVPQGKAIDHPDYAYKFRFFRRLRALFERNYTADDFVLWVGDMNVAPTEIDVTHPETKKKHVCFHEDIRKLFEEVKSWGFIDLFRKHHPDEVEFSFWDYRVKDALERNIGWRVDHILATPPLAARSIDCFIDRKPRSWDRPSDHTFMTALFEL